MARRRIKEPHLIFDKTDPKTILIKFWAKRLIDECNNPQLLYFMTKNPTNPVRLTPEELREILTEIDRRVKAGEVSENVLDKILDVVE